MTEINAVAVPDEVIMNKIYVIRDQKVMLDEDLAELYGVETRRLNEQVRRNMDRFPEDFCFILNEEEFANLMSQFATSSLQSKVYNNLIISRRKKIS
ncbi:ORF6N domain-containing protein [Pedobacter nyackensis]|uniref:ORF6N domain-containing protein n=1 Tax=Pedobacter nyackensis TaxID=475255 RepID=A0A1W2F7Q6_9SPHI|nr:ORF6N domain-containing protein [Pedobacter nyackensis]SMD17556.1 ORF6N domain-containing protein [Pedobacter nyackensis]